MPAQAPRSEDGVWVSRTAPRAVLVATTRADGADLDGQQQALTRRSAVERASAAHGERRGAAARSCPAPAASASPSRERIKSEVERLAIWRRRRSWSCCCWLAFALAARARRRAAAGGDRRARRHRRGQPRLRPGARHDARLRHHADRRGGRLRDLLPDPGARPAGAAAPGDGRARRPALAARRAGRRCGSACCTSLIGFAALLFSGFPGPGAARRVLGRRPGWRRR